MARTFEGTLPSLLQGVSQQIPRERQPGQVGEQTNMLSDPVTGIRRRPGARLVNTLNIPVSSDDALFSAYIERGSDGRHLLINTESGAWYLLNKAGTSIVNQGQSNYLKASVGSTSIQTASIAGLTYILNTEQKPALSRSNTGRRNPSSTGFFYATTSAFSKQWQVTVQSNEGTWTGTYLAPAAGDSDAAAKSRLSVVIENLAASLVSAGMPSANLTRFNNYLYVQGLTNVVVTSDSGKTYATWSNQSRVDQESDLPANLPANADGTMCRVGQAGSDMAWYVFDYSSRQWTETGAYNSVSSIQNMPLELAPDDNIQVRNFEGRLAGDDTNNDDPGFIQNGYITGIAAFQGRLVLLSGPYVSFSASGLYQRFYRSTVTQLLDSDRIDISSASALNSVFRTALQFNRDLVIFGDSMQAVVPGGNAITPTNASIALTSEVVCDSRVVPIVAGQTVLYPNRRSPSFAGIQEFIPSAYTSSQYVSQDATAHLPRYLPGRIMKMVVSSVANVAFVLYSGERNSVLVHEFMWGADAKKVQNAYHKWTLPSSILGIHITSEEVILLVRSSGTGVALLKLDPREGFDNQGMYSVPYADMLQQVEVLGGVFQVPAALRYTGRGVKDFALAVIQGDDAGSELGIDSINASWTGRVVRGVPDGTYYLGLRCPASFTPTPPMLKDSNDNLVGSGHVRLLRFDIAVRNSGPFQVHIQDTSRGVDYDGNYSGIILNSPELAPGLPLKVSLANIIVPCRSNADTTEMQLSTSGTLEMNVLDMTYILRYNQRRSRV